MLSTSWRCLIALAAVASFSGCIARSPLSPSTNAAAPSGGVDDEDWSVHGAPPVPTDGAYFTGRYRNVFAEIGKTPEEIRARIDEAYSTYFSLTDENRLYFELNAQEGYVKDIAHDDVRSEGQSYAMMLAVQRGDQAIFDKLWSFALARMRIDDPAHPSYRGFAWAVTANGEICPRSTTCSRHGVPPKTWSSGTRQQQRVGRSSRARCTRNPAW